MFSSAPIFKSAFVAYLHYLSFMVCFGALIYERINLKVSPNREESISMVCADLIYGISGLTLLISGILRVKYYGQGVDFYTNNLIFWLKIGLFVLVGLVSLYPTFTYLLWLFPLRKGELPDVSSQIVSKLKIIINFELLGFALIPLLATTMSRGLGFN